MRTWGEYDDALDGFPSRGHSAGRMHGIAAYGGIGAVIGHKITDPHSPSERRAAVVRNLDPWYPAFNVQAGQKLYLPPDQRVRMW